MLSLEVLSFITVVKNGISINLVYEKIEKKGMWKITILKLIILNGYKALEYVNSRDSICCF